MKYINYRNKTTTKKSIVKPKSLCKNGINAYSKNAINCSHCCHMILSATYNSDRRLRYTKLNRYGHRDRSFVFLQLHGIGIIFAAVT